MVSLISTPDLNFDWTKGEGTPFNYFSFGAAVSEVEIDCLTGDHNVIRTDIVMDVGDSLNPAVDIGQVKWAASSNGNPGVGVVLSMEYGIG